MVGEDEGLPEHLREPPIDRLHWDRPTAWLLGTKLLASLRDIVLSSVSDFDPRDWMTAGEPIDLTTVARAPDGAEPAGAWIDFLADTGDSPRLVHRLAYLLQQGQLTVLDRDGAPLRFDDGTPRPLPRGAALVIGGDTAYPVSDRATLVERVRAPFLWARAQLAAAGALDPAVVPLVGIPGNHDYYNVLHGHVRNFRTPLDPRELAGSVAAPSPRLDLPGYRACQDASYFALRLPYQWQLWGLDVEMKALDERQRRYFLDVAHRHPTTARIVVTSQPAVVYHAPSHRAPALARIYGALGLHAPFARDGALAGDHVQLDLSGDVHTYERYWGRDAGPDAVIGEDWARPERRGNETAVHTASSARGNYASVVSGLGGAFHHPAQVRHGTMAPRRSWPSARESAQAIGRLLIRPRKVFQAGAVGVVGAILAIIGCALNLRVSHQLGGELLAQLARVQHELTAAPRLTSPVQQAARACHPFDSPFRRVDGSVGSMLVHFATVAAIVGAVVALFGLGLVWLRWMRWLGRWMDAPRPASRWSRLTHRVAHGEGFFWCLRWFGINRRSAWRTLLTLPGWIALFIAVPATVWAFDACPRLAEAQDGYALLYALSAALLFGAIALGVFGAGARTHARPRWKGALLRVGFGLFGLVTGALILWTPYAWTRLATQHGAAALLGLGFVGFWIIRRLLRLTGARPDLAFLGKRAWPRRIIALLFYAIIVGFYVAFPLVMLWLRGAPLERLPWWSLVPAAFFGAYFACQWVGWYFFLCLQWNAHANEAGAAARVADYAEFLRIKLTDDTAEVWTIAAEGPSEIPPPWWTVAPRWKPWKRLAVDDHPIRARLVDHFVVQRTAKP